MAFTCKKCGGHLYRRQGELVICQACEARYRTVRRSADPQPPPATKPPESVLEPPEGQADPLWPTLRWPAIVVATAVTLIGLEKLTGVAIVSQTVSFVMATALLLVILVGGPVFYFLPSLVAYKRHHHNLGAIIVVNCLLGWCFGIGWAVAMAWAMTSPAPVRLTNGQEIN